MKTGFLRIFNAISKIRQIDLCLTKMHLFDEADREFGKNSRYFKREGKKGGPEGRLNKSLKFSVYMGLRGIC